MHTDRHAEGKLHITELASRDDLSSNFLILSEPVEWVPMTRNPRRRRGGSCLVQYSLSMQEELWSKDRHRVSGGLSHHAKNVPRGTPQYRVEFLRRPAESRRHVAANAS
jgi:hypothetical protein